MPSIGLYFIVSKFCSGGVLFSPLSAFFQGVLVESLRKGYWIILDELNLAPSEVCVATNYSMASPLASFCVKTEFLKHASVNL